VGAAALALTSCATAPPIFAPPVTAPARMTFKGTLDLSQPGIGFHLTHVSGLACDAHYDAGRLPETVTVPLNCRDQQKGTLTVVKAATLSGTVALSDGRVGDVTFDPPLARVATTTPVVNAPPSIRPTTAAVRTHTPRGGCGSRGGPGYRLPNGKCASHRQSKTT